MNTTTLIIIATLGMLIMVAFIIVFVLMYQRNMIRKNKEISMIEQQKQIELFDASARAEEREKERIARNLHDEINPMLSVLKLNLQKHKFDILKNKFRVEQFENDYMLIEKISEGLTSASYELVPTFMIRYGLLSSLEDYIRNLNGGDNLKARFRTNHTRAEDLPLSKPEQLNIYRMCLEVINNTLKHSGCSSLDLSVSVLEKHLSVEINHNGKGIDNSEMEGFIKTSSGLGLKSLKARALILNANLDYIKDTSDARIRLSIPYHV